MASKIDIPEARANARLLARKLPKKFAPLYSISAVTGEGVKHLLQRIGALLDELAVPQQEDDPKGL